MIMKITGALNKNTQHFRTKTLKERTFLTSSFYFHARENVSVIVRTAWPTQIAKCSIGTREITAAGLIFTLNKTEYG